jgi:hypothetical protein
MAPTVTEKTKLLKKKVKSTWRSEERSLLKGYVDNYRHWSTTERKEALGVRILPELRLLNGSMNDKDWKSRKTVCCQMPPVVELN